MKVKGKLLAYLLAGTMMISGLAGIPVMATENSTNTVFVGGNGNSDNSGTEVGAPLSSLYSAQELLPNGGTINVTSTIYISGERSYSLNDGIVLKAADTLEGPIFQIEKGGKLELNNIVIIGKESVVISNNGVLKVNNGTTLRVAEEAKGVGCVYTGSEGSTYVDGDLVAGVPEKVTAESESKESEQAETLPAETLPTETLPAETSPSEVQPEESEQTEAEVPESQPEESEQAETQQTETQPIEVPQTESEQTETPQAEIPQTESDTESEQSTEVPQTESTEEETTEEESTDNEGTAVLSPAVIAFSKAVTKLSVHSRKDVAKVVEVSKTYDALSENEKAAISSATLKQLDSAQQMAAAYNQTQLGVSVYGDLPWYVQFKVSVIDITEKEEAGLEILIPYELKLWNLYTNESYTLPKGQKVTVTMPIPDVEIDGEFTIFHYRSDGSVETIKPVIQGNLMSFETDSFSPFSVAGSTLLAGVGIESGSSNNKQSETSKQTNSTESSSSTNNSSSSSNSNSNSNGSKSYQSTSVKTGDNSQAVLLAVIAVIAILVIVFVVLTKKKK